MDTWCASSRRRRTSLQGFRPDLIAEGPDESVIIEVKETGEVTPDRWRTIAQAVQEQPRWRFELSVLDSAENYSGTLSEGEVRERIKTADRLAAQTPDAALLIAWAAAEAALRLAAEKYQVELPDDRPGTLITHLYADGLMDREDYDLLTTGLNQRNAVAHGYRRAVTPDDVAHLRGAAERVLAE